MKIAVIGSGIAGLAATWQLSRAHEVTLFERGPKLGMDAHTAEVDGTGARVAINVPMRVFFEEYYPSLTALYRELGVAYEPVQYSGSFSQFGGDTYFRYRNYWLGPRTFSFLAGASRFSLSAMRIGLELLRLARQWRRRGPDHRLDTISIEDYLRERGYSRQFAERFLFPTFAGICTCSYDSVRAYPASIILEYLGGGLVGSRVNRLLHGTCDAAERMARSAARVELNTRLQSVRHDAQGVNLVDESGHTARFDHVVIATQANQAVNLLGDAMAREREVLSRFRYEQSRVVVHRDARLAPRQRHEWAPVNFLLSAEHDKPMASIWMNRIHPELDGHADVFETWNPFLDIAQDDVLIEARFERPVVNAASLEAISLLGDLQQEADRRVWFCGSYARRGIPLLESAAASAAAVAARLRPAQAA